MDAFLSLGPGGIKSSLKQLTGRPGLGTYRIDLALEWTPIRSIDLAGAHVAVAGDLEASFVQGVRLPLAQLQPLYAVAFPEPEHGAVQTPVNMGANVLPAQLEAIERQRSGGPVTLHLQLQGIIFRPSSHDPSPAAPAVQSFWGPLEYQIKPAQWVEVLEHWRYAQGFLLQVPILTGAQSVKAIRAKNDLEKALRDMGEGRYRDAVSACRDALEAAYGAVDKDLHAELGYKVENLRDADKETRFWLVRRALWAVTHAAKHRDETTQDIEWERRDAAAVVTMLGALLEQDPPL
ncbi:MAG: hypothetical protein ACR2OB_11910 [Solirubrobacteraceae bacterium]